MNFALLCVTVSVKLFNAKKKSDEKNRINMKVVDEPPNVIHIFFFFVEVIVCC